MFKASKIQAVQKEMMFYFKDIIEKRKRNPQDDLISHLVSAEIEGEKLNDRLFGFCGLLIIAGHVTTTNLIGNAILSLGEFPDVAEQLIQDLL